MKKEQIKQEYDFHVERPPLGLIPRNLFLLQRVQNIVNTINIYFESGKEIPQEWIEEYNELVKDSYISNGLKEWYKFQI